MSVDGSLFLFLSTPYPLSEHPRDEKFIRSVLEYDEHSERVQFRRVIPSPKENRRTQTRSIKLFVNMPETGAHWDKRGRG